MRGVARRLIHSESEAGVSLATWEPRATFQSIRERSSRLEPHELADRTVESDPTTKGRCCGVKGDSRRSTSATELPTAGSRDSD